MTSPILDRTLRGRALVYFVITLAFTLLMGVVTIRFALGGDAVETLLLAVLTFGLAFQTRRWFRRLRGTPS
jgi:hypothetical protein